MIGGSPPKPPKPPKEPPLPPQLVDPAIQRAALFARLSNKKAGFRGTVFGGKWRPNLRVLRPGQTGFATKKASLVSGPAIKGSGGGGGSAPSSTGGTGGGSSAPQTRGPGPKIPTSRFGGRPVVSRTRFG